MTNETNSSTLIFLEKFLKLKESEKAFVMGYIIAKTENKDLKIERAG